MSDDSNNDSGRVYLLLDAAVIIGLLFLIGSAIFILAFVNIPEKNGTLFAAVVGTVVGAGLMAYVNNRFGSSKSSAAKDDALATIAKSAGTGSGQ